SLATARLKSSVSFTGTFLASNFDAYLIPCSAFTEVAGRVRREGACSQQIQQVTPGICPVKFNAARLVQFGRFMITPDTFRLRLQFEIELTKCRIRLLDQVEHRGGSPPKQGSSGVFPVVFYPALGHDRACIHTRVNPVQAHPE